MASLLWITPYIPYLGYDAAEVSTFLGKAEQTADGRLRDVQTARELYLPQQVLGDAGEKTWRSQTDNTHLSLHLSGCNQRRRYLKINVSRVRQRVHV